MKEKEALFDYVIRQADNCLILGQRLGEWCGHGPVLEQDIALTNISLDLIGQCRSLYQYAAEVEGEGHTEDDLAYLRDAWQFRNFLLLEQPNRDFAYTVTRQFFFDAFNYYYYAELINSSDDQMVAIAHKSIKEVTYHLKWSSEWMLRLGGGTEESRTRVTRAIEGLWSFTGELTEADDIDNLMQETGVGVDLEKIKVSWRAKVSEVFTEVGLVIPEDTWMQSGGKQGTHTEHLGYILADLQFLQRSYPGATW